MNKVNSNKTPQIIERVGDGRYYYRWGIEESTQPVDINNDKVTTSYNYCEVIVANLSEDNITIAVINALWGADMENKLINDYNAAKLGVLDDSYIDTYTTFLAERKAVKEQIASDYTEYKTGL